eukprot:GHVO01033728.1.p1 GENE.GHVO01033728.1~~GHVO01033728.1.p1  ORF type:complete len:691 (+),score=115.71 GHVO01033728.1:279-2075(+)
MDGEDLCDTYDRFETYYRLRDDSFIHDIFGGAFKGTLECLDCGNRNVTFERFCVYPISIPPTRLESIRILYIPHRSAPVPTFIGVNGGDTIADTCWRISQLCRVPSSRLVFAYMFRSSPRIFKILKDCNNEKIQTEYILAVFEMHKEMGNDEMDIEVIFRAPPRRSTETAHRVVYASATPPHLQYGLRMTQIWGDSTPTQMDTAKAFNSCENIKGWGMRERRRVQMKKAFTAIQSIWVTNADCADSNAPPPVRFPRLIRVPKGSTLLDIKSVMYNLIGAINDTDDIDIGTSPEGADNWENDFRKTCDNRRLCASHVKSPSDRSFVSAHSDGVSECVSDWRSIPDHIDDVRVSCLSPDRNGCMSCAKECHCIGCHLEGDRDDKVPLLSYLSTIHPKGNKLEYYTLSVDSVAESDKRNFLEIERAFKVWRCASMSPNHDVNLESLISMHGSPEVLQGPNAWTCNKCKNRVPAVKSLSLYKCGSVVVIQLKRFFTDSRGNAHRLSRMVRYPLTDLTLPSGDGTATYDLCGVVYHEGQVGQGHYKAACLSQDRWYQFNDCTVSQAYGADAVVNQNAYILAYQRRTSDNANRAMDARKALLAE